jgi:hypothetical protein
MAALIVAEQIRVILSSDDPPLNVSMVSKHVTL